METNRDLYGPLPTPPATPEQVARQRKTKWSRKAAYAVVVAFALIGMSNTSPEFREFINDSPLFSVFTGSK